MAHFSVIIPLYNKANHVKATLESVLAQTFTDFEVIIVNDGSTDGSEAEVFKLKAKRIKIFNIENQGVSHARNYGIEKSSADFIAFIDADDRWYPSHLEDLKILIEQFNNCGIYAKGYESVYQDKNVFKAKFLDIDDSYFGIVNDYFHHSLINQIAWTSAIAIPRDIFNTYGYFDVTMRAGEDSDLWTRIALNEKVAFDSKVSAQKMTTESENHLSQSSHVKDKIILSYKFSEYEKSNESFKKYMDYNRFSIAIERKLDGDLENFKKIKNQINLKNLNQKQKLLLKMPTYMLKAMKKLQNILLRHRIYLSAFR